MKKGVICVISGVVLSLLMTVQTYGAELSGEVEANYRAMGMKESEILSVKDELREVDNPNYITNTEKEFYIRMGIKKEDMEQMQKDSDMDVKEASGYTMEEPAMMRASHGTYPEKQGIILVTKDKIGGVVPLGHAPITTSKTHVIEAHPGEGVHYGLNNWNRTRNTCYGLKVKNISDEDRLEVAKWCSWKKTLPYNWNFYNVETRSEFYCSHLVWAGFKDKYNIDLNGGQYGKAIYPPEMIDSGYVYRIYIQ